MLISSQSNPAIRQIRGLRSRKEREQTGLFFIEGIRIVAEAVQTGAAIESLVVAPDLLTSDFAGDLVEQQRRTGIPVVEVTPGVFESLSSKDGPQGLGAVVRQRWESLDTVSPGPGPGWVALSAVQDPGNLGTILRTADAVGCSGVILVGPTTDPYDPAALRASMGAVFAQRLVRADVAQLAAWKRRTGAVLVGTSDAAATDYRSAAYKLPVVLFMGSERQGLSEEEKALCDLMVGIPMVGRSDSLNLAVATAVVLYELFNQGRGLGPQRPEGSARPAYPKAPPGPGKRPRDRAPAKPGPKGRPRPGGPRR